MPKVRRPRRTNHSTSTTASIVATDTVNVDVDTVSATAVAGTTTSKIAKTKRNYNQKDDKAAFTITTTTMNTDDNHHNDDEELRIYNEQIRYSTAVEFLQQQKEHWETGYSNDPPPHSNSNNNSNKKGKKKYTTTIATTTKSSITTPTNSRRRRTQLTRGMLYTLHQLQTQSCTCQLCHGIYIQPITLVSCTHTFCKSCIHYHTDHSWYCPSTCIVYSVQSVLVVYWFCVKYIYVFILTLSLALYI